MSFSPHRDFLPSRQHSTTVRLVLLGVIVLGAVVPLLATGTAAAGGSIRDSRSADGVTAMSTVTPTTNSASNTTNASSYAQCADTGPIRGAICNTIANAKHSILAGTLNATQQLARSTVELILRRPVPKQDGTIVVFRPPSNEPLAGAYTGWTSVGLPLGFLVWVIGVGVALASRFRPEASFASQGFQIEQRLARNLVLTLGSWWLGAFILHLANGLILAVAPRGDQLVRGAQSGVGSLLGTGLLAGLLWVATAAIVTILLVTTLLAYFLCLTFMVFLPVFSALMLFDTGGVMQTIGQFGQTGWSIFIKAVFFPLPAALVLGAGTFIAGGTMGFVERAVSIGGFADIAGTLAFALVMFVTQLAALVATLWMLLGSRAAYTASGVMAGLGGAALYSRAKNRAGDLRSRFSPTGSEAVAGSASTGPATSNASSPINDRHDNPPSPSGVAGGGVSHNTVGGGLATIGGSPHPNPQQSGGATTAATGDDFGGAAPAPPGSGQSTRDHRSDSGSVSSGAVSVQEPVTVEGQSDLPSGQKYQPGYRSGSEFQPAESSAHNREFVVREHDRFAQAFDDDGDHPGIYLRGQMDGRLYDASDVAGEEWGSDPAAAVAQGRDDVFDARRQGGDSR